MILNTNNHFVIMYKQVLESEKFMSHAYHGIRHWWGKLQFESQGLNVLTGCSLIDIIITDIPQITSLYFWPVGSHLNSTLLN